jgi:glycine dehydrogenase subunit 1
MSSAPGHPPTAFEVHTATDRVAMLEAIGAASLDELFAAIPAAVRLDRPLELAGPLAEWELERHMRALASANATTLTHMSFLGGGAYEHHVPAVVDAIASRGEFLTAYTPYQPEMSQGLLRILHDFQILMGRVLGLPAVNCSVYDGATAVAEAAWMACSATGRRTVVVTGAVWRDVDNVLATYMEGRGVVVRHVRPDATTGRVDPEAVEPALASDDVAAVIVQSPNALGVFEDVPALAAVAHRHGCLLVASGDPLACGLVASPGACGADIAACEAQSLGLPLSAGGPYLGVIATTHERAGLLPGRVVGVCQDIRGDEALALVAEEREQHVSRDRATSHICSNQAWLALRVAIHLAWLGEHGFTRLAALCATKARAFRDRLCAIPGVAPAVTGEFFHEFLLHMPVPVGPLVARLRERGVFAGLPLEGDRLLVSVTETKSQAMLDRAAEAFEACIEEAR